MSVNGGAKGEEKQRRRRRSVAKCSLRGKSLSHRVQAKLRVSEQRIRRNTEAMVSAAQKLATVLIFGNRIIKIFFINRNQVKQ